MGSRYKKHRNLLWFILTPMVTITLVLSVFLYLQAPKKPTLRVATNTDKAATVVTVTPRGLPIRLKIPAINVNAAVEYMGNTISGDMAAPNGHSNVGWYKYGPLPGDIGSSVMAGHVVGPRGEQGVFFRLDKLQAGDILQVTDGKGQVASFTVRSTKTYGQTEQTAEVFSGSGGIHLNLITCAGDWDAANHHYLKRLVVFADKSPVLN
jgi:LPXTG-site transpeptidase (sortase) family protein